MKTIADNEVIDTSRGHKRIGPMFDENSMLRAINADLSEALRALLPFEDPKIAAFNLNMNQDPITRERVFAQARAILEKVTK